MSTTMYYYQLHKGGVDIFARKSNFLISFQSMCMEDNLYVRQARYVYLFFKCVITWKERTWCKYGICQIYVKFNSL